jgi:hypothetical protein
VVLNLLVYEFSLALAYTNLTHAIQGMHQNLLDLEELTELLEKQKTQMEGFAATLEDVDGKSSSAVQPKLETYLM